MAKLKTYFDYFRANSPIYHEDEDSTVSSNGKEYNLNTLLRLAASSPIQMYKVSDLDWVLEYAKVKGPRVKNADLAAPLLVTFDEGRWLALDGAHRLAKARDEGIKELPGRFVDVLTLPLALI